MLLMNSYLLNKSKFRRVTKNIPNSYQANINVLHILSKKPITKLHASTIQILIVTYIFLKHTLTHTHSTGK